MFTLYCLLLCPIFKVLLSQVICAMCTYFLFQILCKSKLILASDIILVSHWLIILISTIIKIKIWLALKLFHIHQLLTAIKIYFIIYSPYFIKYWNWCSQILLRFHYVVNLFFLFQKLFIFNLIIISMFLCCFSSGYHFLHLVSLIKLKLKEVLLIRMLHFLHICWWLWLKVFWVKLC